MLFRVIFSIARGVTGFAILLLKPFKHSPYQRNLTLMLQLNGILCILVRYINKVSDAEPNLTVETVHPFDLLLVEDEPADYHLVRMALKESKVLCNLHNAVDGVDALDFLRREGEYHQAPRPDLILLDLNMPRMDGREFLEVAKADPDLKHIPVVVLTTSEVERDVIASYRLGASGYITKPVDMDQFVEAIRQVGIYWFTLTRLPREDKA